MERDPGRMLWTVSLAAAAAAACAPAPPPGGARVPTDVSRRTAPEAALPAGSLRQDQISVQLVSGALRIEVTPLAGWVLEAAAPDTRDRLRRIAEAHGEAMGRGGSDGAPSLFLVSFSSAQPGTEFHPDDLHLMSRGLRERPAAIRAITPGWGGQRLEQQSTATAVYAFGGELDLARELTVVYREAEDSSWAGKVAIIEAERGRIPGSP